MNIMTHNVNVTHLRDGDPGPARLLPLRCRPLCRSRTFSRYRLSCIHYGLLTAARVQMGCDRDWRHLDKSDHGHARRPEDAGRA
jgi:hypothetical protein